jgi:2-polyprenyl-3-methyl-5-hydroxy-6-metoxy-1,4-benzoquinol methylase
MIQTKNLGEIIVDTQRYNFIKQVIEQNNISGVLLDLGCGNKPYKTIYDKHSKESIGIDVQTTPHKNPNIDVYYDGENIPFEDNRFDVVLCSEVIEHVKHPFNFLQEIHRVLKPGGTLILTCPFLQVLHETPNDFFRYTYYGLSELMKNANLEIIQAKGFSGLAGFTLTLLIRKFLKLFNKLSKILKMPIIYSVYNPFVLVFVVVPQLFYLLFNRTKNINKRPDFNVRTYGIIAIKSLSK